MKNFAGHGLGAARSVQKFAEATNLSLIIVDDTGMISFVNQSACTLFGYDRREMVGAPITIIIPKRLQSAHMTGLARVASGAAPSLGGKTVEVVATRKDGTEFPVEITLSVWNDTRGISAGAVIKDISERRDREAKLLRLASQDTLTGLHNRQQFTNLLAERIEAGQGASVILLDLDRFSDINDMHGHVAGDALLQAAGVRLTHLTNGQFSLARFGSDEFALMLPVEEHAAGSDGWAERILDSLRKPFHLGGLVFDMTASMGIARAPDHGHGAEEIIASADFALSRAKAFGGNGHSTFDEAMRSEAQDLRTRRDEVRQALRQGDLKLYFQPQVVLQTGKITGFEALIRWEHPEHGLLLPGFFLPALEQSLLALDIGWWTLDETCRVIARLNAAGFAFKIGVNLFPVQVRAADLCEKVGEAIARHRIAPEQLELELTEEIALGDDRSVETLKQLRQMGVGIAFDDFGTGFASLRSLQRYPLTTLKIDKDFVRDLTTSHQDAAITRALIAMSRDMRLNTVAEGIETATQEAALIAMGCPSGQGFRYGRAIPESELDALLSENARAVSR